MPLLPTPRTPSTYQALSNFVFVKTFSNHQPIYVDQAHWRRGLHLCYSHHWSPRQLRIAKLVQSGDTHSQRSVGRQCRWQPASLAHRYHPSCLLHSSHLKTGFTFQPTFSCEKRLKRILVLVSCGRPLQVDKMCGYSAEQLSNLCDTCKSVDFEVLDSSYYRHTPGYRNVISSSEQCDLCRLICDGLRRGFISNSKAIVDPGGAGSNWYRHSCECYSQEPFQSRSARLGRVIQTVPWADLHSLGARHGKVFVGNLFHSRYFKSFMEWRLP
jgi:hypothetical protein